MHASLRSFLFAFSYLLLAVSAIQSAPPIPLKSVPLQIDGDTITVVRSFPCRIIANPGSNIYVWTWPSVVKATKTGNILIVQSAPEGTHRINVTAMKVDFDKKEVLEDSGTVDIVVGKIDPSPPIPPGPTPPTPTPGDLPIKGDGLRVLILEESANRTKLPPSQSLILTSKSVRDYLRSKCATDTSAGDNHAWRIWDPDTDASSQPQFWQEALKRAKEKSKATYPWIAIGNGKEGYEGPLPDTVEKALDLLKKYGG